MKFIRPPLVVLLLLSGIARSWSDDAFARLYHEGTAQYEGTAQAELISSQGTRVLIDVHNPSLLSKPATDDDVLLTTHRHPDHINSFFLLTFNGQMLSSSCDLGVKDVSIRGFPAPHNEGDPFLPENATNYAFLILMDGIRSPTSATWARRRSRKNSSIYEARSMSRSCSSTMSTAT